MTLRYSETPAFANVGRVRSLSMLEETEVPDEVAIPVGSA